jgi:hypothetical protein
MESYVNATYIYRICTALALSLAAVSLCQAEELNVFQKHCTEHLHMDEAFLQMASNSPDSFWNKETIRTYLSALNGGIEAARQAVASSPEQDAARAGVLLVGIVRHDISMMQIGFSNGAISYYNGKSIFTPMTMAAACDFADGVGFLLDKGINPNTGNDVGAFNAALANQDDAVERRIIGAGYRIEANYKRCTSSKYILNKNPASIPNDVTMAIQSAKCDANT